MTERLVTIAEAGARLSCSPRTVRRRIATGSLAAYRDGGLLRVPERELERYIAARVAGGPGPSAAGASSRMPGRPSLPAGRLWDTPDPLRS